MNKQINAQVDAHELLTTARAALLQHILPSLPDSLRYEARMIANAMQIASRELKLGPEAVQLEQVLLRQLLSDAKIPNPASKDSANDQRALCVAIRNGDYDSAGAMQNALLAALTTITQSKLAISNPRAISPRVNRS
ncbi:DUF6285 domain-containing protein [Glaciimonas immobilis]|uniref:DUF6285 domain-containing protein n=1 Tax=Glaciimonas immobilis TaxID=728004 RepID=A0A840RSH1_9BURK|nr:DUF6285 domain-containing protein [Glaciimonas immobilis]KAF3997842.1 hypothetical protein HAV38_09620 [Glaciimonas immobilis]MBB5199520.1 hypothetical protein [Glaciimonas immobilis]